jgi:diguanylate cyclase (GGDEF)-like protein/PAS domain S-box-containing protein
MCLIGAFADYRMALRAAEMTARLRSLAEASTEGLAICQDGIIIDGNTSLERLVGAPVKDLVGKPLQALLHNMHSSSALDVQPMEALVVTVRGEMIECEASARTMPYRGGTRTVVSFRDMRKQKAAEHRAHHDPLTGLPNRASFNEHLVATIEKSAAEGGSFAILCVDLDRFKEINDVFGHATGDALLAEVSRRLKTATEGAFLARLGGDEFTLIDAGRPHPAAAEALAARLQASVAGEIRVDDHHLRIGLSIGVAIYPADGGTPLELMANGDAALYRAKADGRGAIRFFEAEMDERIRERRALEHELRSAVARQELTLFYQPQARIDGQVTGFEALARWDHPTLGSIAPGRFIPIAEDSGIIVSLGEWVLREACREAATWVRPLQVSVNLSPIQFRHGDLPTLVHMALLDTGLPPGRLVLEITEGVLIDDFERALTTLRRLKLLGVGIAMDDFGTGYSSLSYLQSFPFDKIKIDRSFINNLARGHQSAAIVRAVIGLGRGLDLPVVAEGVETAEQQAFLSAEDCDEIQGYFVGRPGPMSDYAELVGLPPQPRPAAPATGQIAAA